MINNLERGNLRTTIIECNEELETERSREKRQMLYRQRISLIQQMIEIDSANLSKGLNYVVMDSPERFNTNRKGMVITRGM